MRDAGSLVVGLALEASRPPPAAPKSAKIRYGGDHSRKDVRVTLIDAGDCELVENALGMGVFAKRALPAQSLLSAMQYGPSRSQPWTHSIQIGLHEHAEPLPPYLRYLNHSCDPNLYVDVREKQVETLRPIRAGDELTFFYPATEWRMQSPFTCACGSELCIGEIRGAAELPAAVLRRYRLSPVIVELASFGSDEIPALSTPCPSGVVTISCSSFAASRADERARARARVLAL